jgi:hypothetical protein
MEMKESIKFCATAAFKATVEVRDALQSEVVQVVSAQLAMSRFEEALSGLYYRMALWARTLAVLNDPEHFQAVRSGARAAFELHLDIYHLAKKPGLTEKMFAFTDVWKFSSATKMADFLAKHLEFDTARYHHQLALAADAASRKNFDEAMKTYWPSPKGNAKAPSDWSGKDICRKAGEAGADFELRYRDEYGLGSLFVHSGIVAIDNMSQEALINSYARGHLLFQESYLKASLLVCEAFRLLEAKPGLRKRLEELEMAHEAILTKLLMEHGVIDLPKGW